MTTLKAHGKQLYFKHASYIMLTFGVKKCKILRPFLNTVNGSKCMGAASNPFILFIHFFATKYHFVGVNKLNHYSLKCL